MSHITKPLLYDQVDALVEFVGLENTFVILEQAIEYLEGYTPKQRLELIKTICICDEDSLDGG